MEEAEAAEAAGCHAEEFQTVKLLLVFLLEYVAEFVATWATCFKNAILFPLYDQSLPTFTITLPSSPHFPRPILNFPTPSPNHRLKVLINVLLEIQSKLLVFFESPTFALPGWISFITYNVEVQPITFIYLINL